MKRRSKPKLAAGEFLVSATPEEEADFASGTLFEFGNEEPEKTSANASEQRNEQGRVTGETRPHQRQESGKQEDGAELTNSQVNVLPLSPRYLWEGDTRLDRTAAGLVQGLSGLRWPRRWSAIRRFEMLVEAEIARLQKEQGESAFGSHLVRRFRSDGTSAIELTSATEEELVAREGGRGFRRVVRDESGRSREFFIKRLPLPDGWIEARLSWGGVAWPLFEDAAQKVEDSYKAFLARRGSGQRTLFEDLDEREREEADAQLRLMESVRDARLVLDYLLRVFGRDGQNPILVPAWELRSLLNCENDPHGMRRVRGCLLALQELRFEMHLKSGKGSQEQRSHSFGSLVGEVSYQGRGRGKHTDGVFLLQLAPSAIGCLQVFAGETPILSRAAAAPTIKKADAKPLRAIEAPQAFDWTKTLSPGDLERLRGGYVRSGLTLAPHYDRAHNFSPTQAALLRWIEDQLTLNRDSTRVKQPLPGARRTSAPGNPSANTAKTTEPSLHFDPLECDDREPRFYNHLFCPLLPKSRAFYGALGHFDRNPERGRKLSSLAREVGLSVPTPRAPGARAGAVATLLEDLRLVVEEALGGVVVVHRPAKSRSKGREQRQRNANSSPSKPQTGETWLTLDEARQLSVDEILESLWLLFIAPDFRDRLAQELERYHAARFERGEAPFPIKVRRVGDTDSRPVAPSALIASQSTRPEAASLATQLRAARKARGLSQAAVGAELGVSQRMIANWEKSDAFDAQGKCKGKPISAEAAQKILAWLEETTNSAD